MVKSKQCKGNNAFKNQLRILKKARPVRFYQVQQVRTWSRNYKSPSSSPPPSPTCFRIYCSFFYFTNLQYLLFLQIYKFIIFF
jgi:hypothetical protein